MCDNQVLRRRDYASFNVLGLCIILTIGGSIILLNAVIVHLHRLLRRKTPLSIFRQESWDANELLELQSEASRAALARTARPASFQDESKR
jgi:hypothetical protein